MWVRQRHREWVVRERGLKQNKNSNALTTTQQKIEIFTFSKRTNIHDDPYPNQQPIFISRFRSLTCALLLPVRLLLLLLLLRSISVSLIQVWTASSLPFRCTRTFAARFSVRWWFALLLFIFVEKYGSNLVRLMARSTHARTRSHSIRSSALVSTANENNNFRFPNSNARRRKNALSQTTKICAHDMMTLSRWKYYVRSRRTHKHWFLTRLLRVELWLTLLLLLLCYCCCCCHTTTIATSSSSFFLCRRRRCRRRLLALLLRNFSFLFTYVYIQRTFTKITTSPKCSRHIYCCWSRAMCTKQSPNGISKWFAGSVRNIRINK